jgi:hypothetical protein
MNVRQNRKSCFVALVLAGLPVSSRAALPIIAVQPANQVSRVGDTAWFWALSTNSPPVSYQWLSNGVPIAGATATNYITPAAWAGMNGAVYSVVVSNGSGSVTSSNANLKVLPAVAGRTLVFDDEFDGTTLDTTKWTRQNGFRSNGAQDDGYWYPWNAYLSGSGQLVLRTAFDTTNSTYGAAALASTFQQPFGFYEGKYKFYTQQGHWCAFWSFDFNQGQNPPAGGADGAEIDFMERAFLMQDEVDSALHWDGYGAGSGSAGKTTYGLGMNDGGWHIFNCNWTPTNYFFYIDGALVYSTNAGGVCQVPNFMYISDEIGHFGTGSNAWGTGPITGATLPDYTYVEYVRVYQTNTGDMSGAPVITAEPANQTVNQGAGATFSVSAYGTAPLGYQWQLNGANISGGTGSSYTISSAQPSDAGNYSVLVSNAAGSLSSTFAILKVLGGGTNSPPSITSQPQSQTVSVGASATFSVTAAGTAPLSYQWLFNGGNISGATSSSYTKNNAQQSDAGNYSVVVTNPYGSVTSSNAALTVTTNSPGTLYTFNSGLPSGTIVQGNNPALGVTNAGGFTNSGCMILTRPGSGQTFGQWLVTNDLANGAAVSNFNASFKLYMGNGSGGNAPAPNPGGNGAVFHVGPAPANQYTGSSSSWGNGLDVTFRTYSSPPNTYGINIEYNAATNTKSPGSGTVIATSSYFGFFQTNGASDNFSEAVNVSVNLSNGMLSVTVTPTNGLATNVYGNLVIPNFAAISPGTLAFTAGDGSGAHEDAWIDSVSIAINGGGGGGGSTNTPPSITTQPQSQTVNQGANVTFNVVATGTAPLSYQWQFNGANISGATSASYTKNNVQASDAGNYSVVVTNVAGTVTSSNAVLTVNVPPSITTQPQGQTVNVGANVTFSVTASGTAPLSYQWRFNGTNISGATATNYTKTNVQLSDAGNYSVVVTNVAGSVTSSNAVLTVNNTNTPPSITTQPQSQTVNQGANVTFSVVATGTPPLSYQWQFNGTNISGATSTSYTKNNVQSSDSGNYSVVVTNVVGSVTSSNAVLTVNVPPSITTQPQSQTVNVGANVTFSVVAAGTAPLSYQWRFNATNISGATATNYTLTNVQSSNAGNYSVVVTNVAGSVTSSNALLTVNTSSVPTTTYDFNNGLPAGTIVRGNNPSLGVTNAGGYTNSGCLILTRPTATTQTYGQWLVTNDLAGGAAVSSFGASFKLYMGHGSGGNAPVPNPGGNGLVFHVGPAPADQVTGSATSWGNGLDVTFRVYSSPPNTYGINIEYNAATNTKSPGSGTIISTNSFIGFFQTNGAADNFSEAVDVSVTLSNGMLNLSCSNALIGNKVVYSNLALPNYAPISPGTIAFTASEGAGAHEDGWLDNVKIAMNNGGTRPLLAFAPPAPPQFGPLLLSNGQLTLTWTSGATPSGPAQTVLQSAGDLNGPWTDVTNATSPYTVPIDPNVPWQFYRVKRQ